MPDAVKTAPAGSWRSPITSEHIVKGLIGLGQLAIDGSDTYWTEMRPSEKGRTVLVRRTQSGAITEVTPPDWSTRTRVHEYGGGDYLAFGGTVYFSSFADQRVYCASRDGIYALTPEDKLRYADYRLDRERNRLVCVREDKRLVESKEDVNTIVAIDLGGDGAGGKVLVSGNDFYASPRISPDGKKLCWLTWNHPHMPWDAAELWVGSFDEKGDVEGGVRVAGGPEESIFQPEWGPDGDLYFVSDRTDFWNLYRLREGRIEALCPREAEFGVPQWVFGQSTYAFLTKTTMLVTYTERGEWKLGELDLVSGELQTIPSPYTYFAGIRASSGRAIVLAGSPTLPAAVVALERTSAGSYRMDVLRRSTEVAIDEGYISIPEPIEFLTEGNRTAHAFYYAPKNRDHRSPPGELPPLIVKSHGGPTGATSSLFSLAVQYWTSRGFALLDVNYGGSTGYGRRYRERLRHSWGIVDVDDCVNGANELVRRNQVDRDRLAITGGSAGGFTTLCALTLRRVFKAGASHFGISDLEKLASDARTGNHHKFESRYDEFLIGKFPEQIDVYRERSPIHHADRLACPVIFFQGLDDKVVLPNQSERMVNVLRKKRLPVAYLPFEGEGHGFRRAENIKRALEAELYFYSRVFHFEPADPIEPITIENLP